MTFTVAASSMSWARTYAAVLEAKMLITVTRCSITQLHNEVDAVCGRASKSMSKPTLRVRSVRVRFRFMYPKKRSIHNEWSRTCSRETWASLAGKIFESCTAFWGAVETESQTTICCSPIEGFAKFARKCNLEIEVAAVKVRRNDGWI